MGKGELASGELLPLLFKEGCVLVSTGPSRLCSGEIPANPVT